MPQDLKNTLDAIYTTYHHPSYLRLDPLEFVRKFRGRENREIGGLLCSALSHGRIEQIRRTIKKILGITGDDIYQFCATVPFHEKIRRFSAVKHRFNNGTDIAILLECCVRAMVQRDSLEAFFCEGMKEEDDTIKHALDKFVLSLRAIAGKVHGKPSSTFYFLLPRPSAGSACKRLNMFLRWMIRKDDGIDLGEWTSVPAARLVMPVDTHVAAISRGLGITKRKTVDWKMAEEITAVLKRMYPEDPIRCDFSLCRSGMIDFRNMGKAA